MNRSKRQQENATKFTTPTNVHLQVYDGMPHVLTTFGYTESVCVVLLLITGVFLTLFLTFSGQARLPFCRQLRQTCNQEYHPPW